MVEIAPERRWYVTARSIEAASIAGLVFGGLFFAAVAVLSRQPEPDAGHATILEWLEDGGNADSMVLTQSLVLTALIAFVWFLGVFRRRVRDRVDEFSSTIFLGSGLVLAALAAVGVSLLTAPTIAFHGDASVSAEAYSVPNAVGRDILLVFANGLAGVFTLSSTTMIRRSGVFPRWLAVVGYLVAVSLIVSPFDIIEEMMVFPAWVALVSLVVLIRRHDLPGGHST